ncbi:AAA family ATPase [Citreicella sp. C3M06]|uniref:AAA family ATPase n=1 Tax=Citreicella sp. C3M06 TaxID=2841564 RepID=UPI001C091FB8|nr:AAA family ATPase [Citreicella sp. C3M06]MBU2961461.1 AAA family ATPase [Citreicella sp. C3M06]
MSFKDITLDHSRGLLSLDGAELPLRPKTLAVLAALVERQGEVVSQEELRRMVWGVSHGSHAGPKQCIRELRRLLSTSHEGTDLIETVGRQGYRLARRIHLRNETSALPPEDRALCVGRAQELEALNDKASAAWGGQRAVVLVSGEAGAGKTRLVETFIASLPQRTPLWTVRGQALAHPGAREPYGLLLDALSELGAGPEGDTLARLLPKVAPTWAALLPGSDAPWDTAPFSVDPDKPATMRREFTALMERLTRGRPGVLLLEDLHWADPSTLAWLVTWGLQRTPARLLVLGTYRDEEVDRTSEMSEALGQLSRQSDVLSVALGGLDAAAVAAYLAQRFPGHQFPPALAEAVFRRTEGHAILVDEAVDHWLMQGHVGYDGLRWQLKTTPEDLVSGLAPSIRTLIESDRVSRLSPEERALLETASVAGQTFSAPDLADDQHALEAAERQLENLARNHRFISHAGLNVRPDGSVATRYAFRHALHHAALYEGLPAANRQGTHRRIGLRLEAGHGPAVSEIAPTLADHFERGADWSRAAHYRTISGQQALERGAASDAEEQFHKALALHARSAETDREAQRSELHALLGLAASLTSSQGFTGTALREIYDRAGLLATRVSDPAGTIPVLAGLWNDLVTRAELDRAKSVANGLVALADNAPAQLAMTAHNAIGQTHFFAGALHACPARISATLEIARSGEADGANILLVEDPEVVCHQYAACFCEMRGQETEAEYHIAAATTRAERLGQPFAQAQALWAGAVCARLRGDARLCLIRSEALIALCHRENVTFWEPSGQMLAWWAQAMQGEASGVSRIEAGMKAYAAIDMRLTMPFNLGLLAEVAARQGEAEKGLHAIRRAYACERMTGERWYSAELHRFHARLAEGCGRHDIARRALGRAIADAKLQGSFAFRDRAAKYLASLSAHS